MNKTKIVLSIIFPPLAVLDKGCGAILLVSLLTAFFWLPGTIAALLICSRSEPEPNPVGVQTIPSTPPTSTVVDAVPVFAERTSSASQQIAKIRTRFIEGMRQWLQRYGFHVGLPARDIDRKKDIEWLEKKTNAQLNKQARKIAENITGDSGMPVITTGGKISAEDLLPLVAPFIESSDMFGYNFIRGNKLFIMLFADHLPAEEIKNCVKHYLELQKPLRKKAGLRQNFTTTILFIDILLVFLDSEKCMQTIADLNLHRGLGIGRVGYQASIMDRVAWQYLFINIPDQKVYLGNKVHEGTFLSASKYREAAGSFYTEDLIEVLNYEGELAGDSSS